MCFEGNDVPEKRKRDQFKKLVSGIVGVRIILQFDLSLHPLPLCQRKINFDSPQSDISKGTVNIDRVCFYTALLTLFCYKPKSNRCLLCNQVEFDGN